MTWNGSSMRVLTADELADAKCHGGPNCQSTGEHAPRYMLEAINEITGEVRRWLFCLHAGAAAAYKLSIDFPPKPSGR